MTLYWTPAERTGLLSLIDAGYELADLYDTYEEIFHPDIAAYYREVTMLPEEPIELDPPLRLPTDPTERKNIPLAAVLDYFPDALAEIAKVIKVGNDQHNKGQPIHWARGKSMDHADCLLRHFVDRGSFDGTERHSAKLAWRALAMLQLELEEANCLPPSRGSRVVDVAAIHAQYSEDK